MRVHFGRHKLWVINNTTILYGYGKNALGDRLESLAHYCSLQGLLCGNIGLLSPAFLSPKILLCFQLHSPKIGTGKIYFLEIIFIFSFCAIFLNFMLLDVNFGAI